MEEPHVTASHPRARHAGFGRFFKCKRCAAAAPTAVGTAFTYQGRLLDNGASANGQYDFQFKLYDALS